MADITLKSTGYYKVDPLYQWDLNQTLYIYGVSVVRPVIHFNNKSMVNSIVRQPSIDKAGVISVIIPNSLLQKTEAICVYVCAYEGDAFKTYYKMEIPVKSRPKPADYTLELDDEEVYSFVKLEQKLADALADYKELYDDTNNRVEKCATMIEECKEIENNCISETNAVKKSFNELSSNNETEHAVFRENLGSYAKICDITNVIHTMSSAGSWTATEDCWISFYVSATMTYSATLTVDGVTVFSVNPATASSSNTFKLQLPPCIFVRKDSEIKLSLSSASATVKIYGCLA